MDGFPVLPDSALVSRDGNDVFVSFHWECPNINQTKALVTALGVWLLAFAKSQGAVVIEEFDGGLNE